MKRLIISCCIRLLAVRIVSAHFSTLFRTLVTFEFCKFKAAVEFAFNHHWHQATSSVECFEELGGLL